MERNVSFEEISDGKRYKNSDIVKIGCNDCSGCSSCCENMGGLITLDPYDIHRMAIGLSLLTEVNDAESSIISSLFSSNIALIADRGVVIPTLKMDEKTGKCTFLNENGRCSIHDYRSGVCRLFPLGRIYEDNSFSYFIQKDECPHPNKTKVKIKNWMGTKDINKYEKYICDWHFFIRDIQEYAKSSSEEEMTQVNNVLLKMFFITPYNDEFYEDFYSRLNKVKQLLT